MTELLSRYNPNAKISHGEFSLLVSKLAPYKDMINVEESKNSNLDTKQNFDPQMIKMGQDIQEKISIHQNEIKEKLLMTFFSLSNDEVQALDILEFDELYQKIISEKPRLVDFLYLPKIKQATTQQESTLTSSPVSQQITQESHTI